MSKFFSTKKSKVRDEDEKPRKKKHTDDDEPRRGPGRPKASGTKTKEKEREEEKPKTKDKGKPKDKDKTKPKKSRNDDVDKGIECSKDTRWCEPKVLLFKTLKQLGAVSPKTSVSGREIINRSNERLTSKHVRHYSYHARATVDHKGKSRSEGLIEIANPEDRKGGYLFYLTKSGQKIDPVAELKKQEKEKYND